MNASLLIAPLCGANNVGDNNDSNDGGDSDDDDSNDHNEDDGEDSGGLFSATSRRMNHKTASLLTTQVEYISLISTVLIAYMIVVITYMIFVILPPHKSV